MFDYFDAGIMEGLQHRLVNMTEVQTQGNVAIVAGKTVSLHSKVRLLAGQCLSSNDSQYFNILMYNCWRMKIALIITQFPLQTCTFFTAMFILHREDRQ
jgi:hypothetical protein